MSNEKIFIGIDNERIELTGADKEAFLADRKARADYQAQIEAEKIANAEAKSALLARLGITEDEAKLLLS
jgi:hypothetical protein